MSNLNQRKPARSRNTVPADVLAALNRGTLETMNLVEALAIDLPCLVGNFLDQTRSESVALGTSYTDQIKRGGAEILTVGAVQDAMTHLSDTLRGMSAFAIGQDPSLDLPAKLNGVRPLAADRHFAVREWAWMGIRDAIVLQPFEAVQLLREWVLDDDPNVRRFASEATRPRGVWCAHLPLFKEQPEHGLPLLEPLRNDTSRYVQDSVANWLNDAAKTCPEWVWQLTSSWLGEDNNEQMRRLVARARRSLTS